MHRNQAFGVKLALLLTAAPLCVSSQTFYQQNFDGLSIGSINGQDSWSGTSTDVVQSAVVVSGRAVYVQDNAVRTSIFAAMPTNAFGQILSNEHQIVSFDMLLDNTISGFVGQASVDIQHTIQIRGPAPFKQGVFVYKANTTGGGAVNQNRFEFRAASTSNGPNTVDSNVWYHVVMDFNFQDNTLDGLITTNGAVYFDPPKLTGLQLDGNVNYFGAFSDNAPHVHFYLDNFLVALPEPSVFVMMGLGGLILWRRSQRNG